MANTFQYAEAFLPVLDDIYKKSSVTAIANIDPQFVREGHKAGSFLLPSVTLVGLGDYSRANGYAEGDVTFEWVEYEYANDRGREMSIDSQDDAENLGIAFGITANQFYRRHVVPEIDATRFANWATAATEGVSGAITDASGWIDATNDAYTALLDNECPTESLVLFITADGYTKMASNSDLAAKSVLGNMPKVIVPTSRFSTAVTLNAGATSSAGGFTLAGNPINFMMADREAVFADTKHGALKVFSPDVNQSADAFKVQYRVYHDAWVLTNKENGVYVHSDDSGS